MKEIKVHTGIMSVLAPKDVMTDRDQDHLEVGVMGEVIERVVMMIVDMIGVTGGGIMNVMRKDIPTQW